MSYLQFSMNIGQHALKVDPQNSLILCERISVPARGISPFPASKHIMLSVSVSLF